MSNINDETAEEQRAEWRRRYRLLDKTKRNKYKREYYARNKARQTAHDTVCKARKCGLIASPMDLKCERCGGDAREYHHANGYEGANALRVVAVCRPCHKVLDGYKAGAVSHILNNEKVLLKV